MSQVPKFLANGLVGQHQPAFGKGTPSSSSPSWARRATAPELPVAVAAAIAPPIVETSVARPPAPASLDQRIEDRIAELGEAGQLLETQAQADALEVGMMVARRLLDRELEASPLALEGLVKVALRRLGEVKKVTVRLNPKDHARLTQLKGFDGQRITLVADPKLEPSDVMVETDTQTFDGRLSTRLEELANELRANVVEKP